MAAPTLENGGLSWLDRSGLGNRRRVAEAPESPFVAPEAPSPAGRSFGFQSGAARPGNPGDQHLALAAANGATLGDPTSFKAGAGAPAPVEVVRGMRTTYTNPAPDSGPEGGYNPTPFRNTAEYATPVQAGQAFNRGMAGEATAEADARGFTDPRIAAQFGSYREPGQTGKEILATKEGPGAEAFRKAQAAGTEQETEDARRKAAAQAEKERVTSFESAFLRKHGTATPKKLGAGFDYKMPDNVNAEDYDRAVGIARTQGHEAAMQDFAQSQQFRHFAPLFTPENLATHGVSIPPAVMSNPEVWRATVLRFGPRLAATPEPVSLVPATKPWWQQGAEAAAEGAGGPFKEF